MTSEINTAVNYILAENYEEAVKKAEELPKPYYTQGVIVIPQL
jgi:hypothetical protein